MVLCVYLPDDGSLLPKRVGGGNVRMKFVYK